ncbi:MAG: hypothetical protein QOJ49_551 [Actinomycetota bacterium]|jgi:hypothetical protein|nr:hypothetical protein [Actinomycetota bacterium]
MRRLAGASVLVISLVLLVAGCAPSGSTPSSTTSSSGASSTGRVKGTEIVVSVVNGKVSPPTHRVKVSKDTHIRLLVTSDKADEVHVHGYNIERPLAAGKQVSIEFVANQVGLFEIETHKSGLQLVQLEVR